MVLSKTHKILFSVAIAFSIALGSFLIFQKGNYVDRVEISIKKEIEFYTKNFETDEKKIFVLGSSHIMAVNTTLIESKLLENNYEYSVYNLAKGGDVPKDRIPTLEYLIKSKPEIVVYGIAERDFRGAIPIQQESANTPESPLPNLKNFFDEIFWQSSGIKSEDYEFLSNPKLTTLTTAYNFTKFLFDQEEIKENRKDRPPFENTPFFKIGDIETIIRTDDEVKNIFENIYEFREIPPSYKNPQVSSFKEIITELNENNIGVIIFITPHHEVFQNSFPKKIERQFEDIINEIETEYDLEIHSLYDKYNNLKIWNNPSHVAVNKGSVIFSNDIVNLILEEIEG